VLEFDHISIRLWDGNVEACPGFYRGELGFTVRKVLEKPGTVMTYYSHGADTLETLYAPGKPKVDKPLGHIALRVGGCAGMKAYLEANGVVCAEPKESAMGGFNVMNVAGPDGETIEFLDRPALEEYEPG
jgi:catechol 2,3-dioxygenase-like lactoylglutathione lyase family enzyme